MENAVESFAVAIILFLEHVNYLGKVINSI